MDREARKTILLVEDEVVIALAEKAALGRMGYEVVLAADGVSAVARATIDEGIDLVLMDINLGRGIDGPEAAALIARERDVPVVFLSSHEEKEVVALTEKLTSYGYVVKSSSSTVLDASIKMAFRLFEAHREIKAGAAALHQKNQVLEGMMEHFPGSVFWKDRNSVYLGCNTEEARSSGASSPRDIIGKTDFELGWTDHDAEFYRSTDRRVIETGESVLNLEYSYHMGDGELVWVSTSKVPLYDGEGGICGVFGVALDISARKRAEAALRESEANLSRAERVAGIGNWKYLPASGDFGCSRGALAVFGAGPEGFGFEAMRDSLLPGHRAAWDGAMGGLRARGGACELALEIRRIDDGETRALRLLAEFDPAEGAILGVVEDDTERRRAAERTRSLLAEKELLLKEVHHRVKNNMGSIVSLLGLQAGRLADPAAVAALEDAGSRVRCLLLLYDKLYASEHPAGTGAAEYLSSLVEEILESFPGDRSVEVSTRIDDFSLDKKRMQSLGIIVYELLTNVMKHAFNGRAGGRVSVTAALGSGIVSLVIRDDGRGMSLPADRGGAGGFGLLLVRNLAEQLEGSFRIEGGGGTAAILEFPLPA